MCEMIICFGWEGIGVLWMMVELVMFVVGVMLIFSYIEKMMGYLVVEYFVVSYLIILFW